MTNPKPLILHTATFPPPPDLLKQVERFGWECRHLPLLKIQPLREAFHSFPPPKPYSGLFFSSAQGVKCLMQHLNHPNLLLWKTKPVYACSGSVRSMLMRHKWPAPFVSREKSVKGFIREWTQTTPHRWLHPCSQQTRMDTGLFMEKNIEITNHAIYRPQLRREAQSEWQQVLSRTAGILLYSGSGVRALREVASALFPGNPAQIFAGRPAIPIGASAGEALEDWGILFSAGPGLREARGRPAQPRRGKQPGTGVGSDLFDSIKRLFLKT